MQEFLIHLIIVVLMSGVLLFWAIPFIALAVVLFRKSALWFGENTRLALACGIAAAGIAPHFDAYRQPLPIWLRRWNGDEVSIGYALASLVITWAVVYGQMRLLRRHRRAPASVSA
jgi:hypothetical protein